MNNVIDIQERFPHVVQEVICVKCGERWIAVAPENLLLKNYECKNCVTGYVIKTGQNLTP